MDAERMVDGMVREREKEKEELSMGFDVRVMNYVELTFIPQLCDLRGSNSETFADVHIVNEVQSEAIHSHQAKGQPQRVLDEN